MTDKLTCTVDHDCNLVITIPEIYDALKFMDAASKGRIAAYLACDDDLFKKIVGVLADGFCTPDENDWRWWSPVDEKEARALLDSRLGDVAERRIEDLKHEIESREATIALEKKWQDLYRGALAPYVGGWDKAHSVAASLMYEQERQEREQKAAKS